MYAPIIVGGNGHSGTRVFAEILEQCGVYLGIPRYSYDRNTKDLNVRGLMNRWMKPYLLGLDEAHARTMHRQFHARIRLLIPFRRRPWGFKNPRSMFLLPFYHDLFPEMKFIHVVRDGRDMCFGNPFVHSPTYWGILTEEEFQSLPPPERMMRFWGESNRRAKSYGESRLGDRYLRVRFEDLCDDAEAQTRRIVEFAGGPPERVAELASIVKRPRSIGRWKKFDESEVQNVIHLGRKYLAEFGYV